VNDPGAPDPVPRQHAFPGEILMGAQSRLIPYHIPLRFFISAALFHVAAWLLLVAGYTDVAGYSGGPGFVLAALHALTLGVLAMTAMGAAYQLLNVATGISISMAIGRFDVSSLSSWFYIPGTVLLVAGMAEGNNAVMLLSGAMVVTGMVAFAVVVGTIFHRAVTLKITLRHGWAALICMVLLASAGLALISDLELGFLSAAAFPDHADLAIGHAILGGFGFMGLFVLGFSYILVPMFALSSAPNDRHSKVSLNLVLVALAIAVPSALAGNVLAMSLAGVIGLAGVTVHLMLMCRVLRDGMKKRLGLSFVMVRSAWVALPLTIITGELAAVAPEDFNLPSLFVFILIFGWLLTFLTGMLQRILPFLTSMHAHKLGQRAPRLSEMGHQKVTLKLHAACHGSALVLVSAGIVTNEDTMVLAGGLVGSLGAAAFLWFTLGVGKLVVGFHAKDTLAKQP